MVYVKMVNKWKMQSYARSRVKHSIFSPLWSTEKIDTEEQNGDYVFKGRPADLKQSSVTESSEVHLITFIPDA